MTTASKPIARADHAVESAWRRPFRIVERNATLNRHYWMIFVGRLLEPFLYLFSIGVGVGALVSTVVGPDGSDTTYQAFVAPAMVATSAMNMAVFGSVMDFYSKYKWVKSFDTMLATPISVGDIIRGELLWILAYVAIQGTAYVITMAAMGLIRSWWGLLLVPAGLLVAFAFATTGFVVSSYLRSWLDFEYVTLLTLPLYLFSASFFPLDRYPGALAFVVQLTPLYHGVDLARDLSFGTVNLGSLVSVAYLLVMGRGALAIADRRVARKLRP